MSDPVASVTARIPARSLGLKLLLVCAVALLMSIVALAAWAIVYDRTSRAQRVSDEISDLVGGPQSFVGPVLAVPYTIPATPGVKDSTPVNGTWIIFPVKADAQVKTKTELRHRGIFSAPVWTADVSLASTFDLDNVEPTSPKGIALDWSRAEYLVGATDPRGAQSDVILRSPEPIAMAPASVLGSSALEVNDDRRAYPPNTGPSKLSFFGAGAGGLAKPGAKFSVSADLKYAGAKRLAVLAYGRTTTVQASGDWTAPSYDGGFLPVKKAGDGHGFSANWSVPFVARGVAASGDPDVIGKLGATSLGVSFVEQANPYQSVSRSLKYAPMFIGLVFLAYFLFETTQRRRVHPAQYVLIGLAQIIFYMLLLSIAERLGFDAGFGIAAVATVGLISAYAGWVFESRRQGFIALGCFTALYGLIYVLMRLEDLALLVGAVASFAAIAAAMYFTRRIDWYGQSGQPAPPPSVAAPKA